ncbi:hypothetical protein MUN81_10825 [Hymenobacter sp. 5317J-9]|uniref:hypothetical protein n=1 Tax=Hymenobacter sp. 5317J-9 TaxID=2932250 RepID=UPI001FD63944|nr:hypothetical protein [Hymenobacter sp. 5317J-9]UOQ99972.1 hypothetical protein MUN81_10825 [Hymenobacter sp. 5317J-9]
MIDWNAASPYFYTTEVPEDEKAVEKHFSKSHIRYMGSWQACSCGFNAGTTDDFFESANSARALVDYIRTALKCETSVEFYTCWAGNQSSRPELKVGESIDNINVERDGFSLEENVFVTFIHSADR